MLDLGNIIYKNHSSTHFHMCMPVHCRGSLKVQNRTLNCCKIFAQFGMYMFNHRNNLIGNQNHIGNLRLSKDYAEILLHIMWFLIYLFCMSILSNCIILAEKNIKQR